LKSARLTVIEWKLHVKRKKLHEEIRTLRELLSKGEDEPQVARLVQLMREANEDA
jgi:hypothetical protein